MNILYLLQFNAQNELLTAIVAKFFWQMRGEVAKG